MSDGRGQGSLTDLWASMVEATGSEVGVTLLVRGVLVSGVLTPTWRFTEHARAEFSQVFAAGGALPAPTTARQISDEEREQCRVNWRERFGDLAFSADGVPEEHHVEKLCLRNAILMIGDPTLYPRHAFLLIEASSVDAFALGALEVRVAP